MKIIHKVTLRHMRQNKKKTFVTLAGIILSVALMTAISSFAASFLDLMRQDAIQNEGNWHIRFRADKETAEKIAGDEQVETPMYALPLYNGILEDSQNDGKPYLMIEALDEEAMKNLLGEQNLLAGRYPQNDREIVIPQHLKENGGVTYQIGDEITLSFGRRVGVDAQGNEWEMEPDAAYFGLYEEENTEKLVDTIERTYQVVGIVKRPSFEARSQAGYTAVTLMTQEMKESAEQFNLYVLCRHVTNEVYDWMERYGAEEGVTEFTPNDSVLSTYMASSRDSVNRMLDTLKWIMIVIVMGGSISVIYSSFSISVAERSKYLGMLSSVGATRRQKMDSVYYEAFLLGVTGIPLGILLGLAGTFFTMQFANPLLKDIGIVENIEMRMVISWSAIGGAAAAAAATILLSAYLPARRASKVSPIDGIRQSKEVKLSRRQVKTSRFTKALFGFEGELALKNLKRNRGRYRATILSLTISIALFLGISGFSTYLADAYTMDYQYMDQSDLSFYVYENFPKPQEFFDRLSQDGLVTAAEWQMSWGIAGYVEGGTITEEAAAYYGEVPRVLNISLVALDEESLKAYAQKVGADYNTLTEEGRYGAILYNNVYGYVGDVRTTFPVLSGVSFGQDFTVSEDEENFAETTEEGPKPIRQTFYLAAVTGERPLGGSINASPNAITLYMSRQTLASVLNEADTEFPEKEGSLYLTSNNPDALLERFLQLHEEWKTEKGYDIYYISNTEIKQESQSTLMFMNIFVYGFIILTSLICATSIFNTISTSMALRRREYAMLQSVGMDGKQFRRMIRYESLFYGGKALLYGLPLGILLTIWIYQIIATAFDRGFYLLWPQIFVAVAAVFLIVGVTMRYSAKKIEKENIVDTLKEDIV